MNYKHVPLMAAAFATLILGMWAGLLRSGWHLPTLHDDFALVHGILMVGGFMGTLISLERAVALGEFLKAPQLRQIPYLAPLLSGLGALALVVDLPFAAFLMTLSSVGMSLMFAYIVRKHPAIYTVTMALGAFCWLAGNMIWLAGEPLFMSAPWWMAFLILTIAGERLELSRVLRHARRSLYLFAGVAGILLCGLLGTRLDYDFGMRLMGVGSIGLAVWLLRYDIVRRTIWQNGLPRFIAACLGLGYFWLATSGGMSLVYGGVKAGLIYDAVLHAVFLGFAFSMIFGHAPLILPAILGITLRYSPGFYAHLMLLHFSLLLRVSGDLLAWSEARRWGSMLNAVVLVFFLFNMIRSLQSSELKPLLPRNRPAYLVYGFALPLFLIGFILVGAGVAESLQGNPPEIAEQALVMETAAPALGEVEYSASEIATGEQLYQSSCTPCHGADLQGVQGLGKNLLTSEFVAGQTDSELQVFIVKGRPIWDEQNTTGIDMPPRGGNPSLSDEDIQHIIAYIRAGH
jgi:cytochrome c5